MLYRRFGKTDLMMPVLSFGCMRSMQSWQDEPLADIKAASQDNLEALVHTALAHGITHIETASGYGSSERQLGLILEQLPRKEILLQTKVVPSADPDAFVQKIKESMERLRVDRLDLLALHGINDYRSLWQCCKKNGCLAAARKLQDKGMIDHVGFSGHGPCEVIVEALTHQEDGGFDYCNVHWYYIFDANRAALETAAERDIGIFIISPSDKGGHLHTPSDKLKDLCAPFSPMLFNDLYCLDQPGVQTISIGASEPHHFDEHLKVLALLEHDERSAFLQIDARLRQAMYDASGFERPDHFWDLLPAWEQAPGNINLKMVLWLYNIHQAWDMKNYSRERYEKLSGGSSWVPGNNGSAAALLDLSAPAQMAGLEPEHLQRLLLEAHQTLSQKNPVGS